MTEPHWRTANPVYVAKYRKYYQAGYRIKVPILGTQRRLQALMAIGWSQRYLARRLEVTPQYLAQLANGERNRESVYRSTAKRVDALYRELWLTPNPDPLSAKRVKTWAKKKGYVPPGAWDDIDDPNEQPKGVRWQSRECVVAGCDRDQERRTWCKKHYDKYYLRPKKEAA